MDTAGNKLKTNKPFAMLCQSLPSEFLCGVVIAILFETAIEHYE